MNRIALALASILATALLVAACGDSEDPTSTSASTAGPATEETASTESTPADATAISPTDGSCSPVESLVVEPVGDHLDKDFTADDYPSNPPSGGDHNPNPLQTGRFYDQPPRLGEAVHALEHGAVIGWTNELSAEDTKTVNDAFNAAYSEGYFQLAVVENPDLEVPFALSSWGALQQCEGVDAEAIAAFIEEHYAPEETAEGALACTGKASRLPACAERQD